MRDEAIIDALQSLGIDRASYKVIALLPLVEMAWADGKVQEEERRLILGIASNHGRLGGEGLRVLENWLAFEPSPETKKRGSQIVAALLQRREGFGHTLMGGHDQDVLEMCEAVAKAAGKLFGVVSVMTPEERKALGDIERALDAADVDDDDPPTDIGQSLVAGKPQLTIHTWGTLGEACIVRLGDDPFGPEGERIAIGEHLTVGRGAENKLQISNDGLVSRLHCAIGFADGKYYVRDQGSTNGTLVNGDLVKERRLFGGEILAVGHSRFRFVLGR
jgi:tellurite resistance protein